MFEPLFRYLNLFRTISEADTQLIESVLTFQHVAENDFLVNEGSVSNRLYFICQGVLRIVKLDEEGNQITHFFLKENQLVTILDSFNTNTPAKEGIQAACNTDVIVIAKIHLLALYDKLPYLKELIGYMTQQTLLHKIQTRNAYLGQDAATRYKQFLLLQPDIALRVSLQDIASYLGITQQSLSRIRRNLR